MKHRRAWPSPIAAVVGSFAVLGCGALLDLSEVNEETPEGAGASDPTGGTPSRAGSGADPSGLAGEGGGPSNSGTSGTIGVAGSPGIAGEGGGPGDSCSPNPCANDGECTVAATGVECTCSAPYSGDRCEINEAQSCLDWRRLRASEDGVYSVDPDGDGDEPAFDVYCDMTSDGGGWTLVATQSIENGYLEQWGTTAQNLESPAPDELYVLDFRNRLPEPGEVRMRHEPTASAFTHTILRDGHRTDAGWETQSGATGLRRRVVANDWWLTFSRGMGAATRLDYFCVTNAKHLTGFNCDGNVGQAEGQGLYSPHAGDEMLGADMLPVCPVENAIWKQAPGAPTGVVCNPRGFVTVWFREPAASCNDLHDLGVIKDGVYAIDPDDGGPGSAFNVYCDMTTRGGGWTLVAINGQSGRPAAFHENRYPRPGASFYSTIETALLDLPQIRAGNVLRGTLPITQYSINAKTLYTASAREVLAYVGGVTRDYIYGTLPGGCNFFDGATSCKENMGFFDVFRSNGMRLTNRAQACTTANRAAPFAADVYDEFGLHILAGTESNMVGHCNATTDTIGPQDLGRIYTTFNSFQSINYWTAGVHVHWNETGGVNVPGYLMIR